MDYFKKKNIRLLSISTDSVKELKKFQEKNQLSFSLICDKGAKLAEKFDVDTYDTIGEKKIKAKQAIPSKFLIDSSGKVVWTYIPKSKPDRPDIETIKNAIETCI
ncbi:MAG: putative Thioredoxin-dependent thiol peroxidase [Promethearchaeota archaeon]|nr:MAG: putative Thioredoxin-dependent thiol peroxidase [Candidatus Lokiarchaeota archaeon]